jgi:hypothetical protein
VTLKRRFSFNEGKGEERDHTVQHEELVTEMVTRILPYKPIQEITEDRGGNTDIRH